MSARSRFMIVQPDGNVSWHVGVRTSDGRFRTIGKRMRDRKDKTKKRRAWTLTQLESSELPAAGPSDDEEAWETLIDGVHDRWTKEENVSRKMDKAREYCKRWNGKVPITDLSRDGYADLGVLSGIEKKDLSTLHRHIMASTARSHTHGGAVAETPTTSIFLKEPGEKVEQWMEEEGAITVQGEELGALRRIKAALKAAVGKEGMDRTITEGLVAKLGREGRPAQTAYPERHGDFLQPHEIPDEWSEKEKGEAAENSFTTPVLAVMLVLSPGGGVQTLFPSMSKKFTQTMGEQPIAWGREEGEEEVNYYEGRFLRWELVKQGGKGDQVPMSSASGASSGMTKGGKTRAHPSRSGAHSNDLHGERAKSPCGHVIAFDATGVHSGPGTTLAECGEDPRCMLYMAFPGASLLSVGGAPVYASSEGLKGKEGEDYHLAFDQAGRYKLGRYPPGRLAKDRFEKAAKSGAVWAERRKR